MKNYRINNLIFIKFVLLRGNLGYNREKIEEAQYFENMQTVYGIKRLEKGYQVGNGVIENACQHIFGFTITKLYTLSIFTHKKLA